MHRQRRGETKGPEHEPRHRPTFGDVAHAAAAAARAWRRASDPPGCAPSQCPAGFEDFDPYTCGDDLIIPSKEDDFNSAHKFMNKFKPPGMDDFTFIEVPDSEDCWTAQAFTSGAASLSSRVALLAGLAISLLLWR